MNKVKTIMSFFKIKPEISQTELTHLLERQKQSQADMLIVIERAPTALGMWPLE